MKHIYLFLAMFIWVFASCEKTDWGSDFENGKHDGVDFCYCIDEPGLSAPEYARLCIRCEDRHLDMRKVRIAVGLNGDINDYVAGLITAPCMLDYLLNNHYLDYLDY
jgi:hypothetical protein